MSKLTISNFLCIRDAELEIHPFTIIIGPQASGKSIISKLIYYFNSFFRELRRSLLEGAEYEIFYESFKKRFFDVFPQDTWKGKQFKIQYKFNNEYYFIIENKMKDNGQLALLFNYNSKIINKLYSDIISRTNAVGIEDKNADEYDIQTQRERLKAEEFNKKLFSVPDSPIVYPYYVPAGRSFFTSLDGNLFSFLSNGNHLDYFIREFGLEYKNSRFDANRFMNKTALEKMQKDLKPIDEIIVKILSGSHRVIKNKEFISNSDGYLVPIAFLSSGQQETLPLCKFLRSMASRRMLYKRHITIEEPEAHIFPQSQWEIMKLINLIQGLQEGISFLITTHSPYILTSSNILLMISKLSEEKKSKLGLGALGLDSGCVGAYTIQDGVLKTIVDEDLGLISENSIDSVSATLSDLLEKIIGER